jgi:predicted enzyme related to lactoylglutathione lyase
MDLNLKLELVPVPVSDVDRAKEFYVELLGFVEDVDVQPVAGVRVVQLTPQGSACSIVLSSGLPHIDMAPGSLRGLHLVVNDIGEARDELITRGVEVGEVDESAGQGVKYAHLSDPDGNTWALQEMPWRTGAAY